MNELVVVVVVGCSKRTPDKSGSARFLGCVCVCVHTTEPSV